MSNPILEVSDIQKYYGNKGNITKAVNHISFSIEKGEFVGIMGASGSGKTTLLNCISTIDTVTSGHIFVEGKDITTLRGKQLSAFRREKLGFIFQDFNLLDTLTAYENISLALSISGVKAAEIDRRVTEIAKALNITEKNGNIVSFKLIQGEEDIIIITNTGTIIRLKTNQISSVGRVSQGVRLIHLKDNQQVSSATIIDADDEENSEETSENDNNNDIK